jgi:periplasmic copper chaperone A
MLADESSANTNSMATGVSGCDRLALDNDPIAAAQAAQIKSRLRSIRIVSTFTRFMSMLAVLLCLTQGALASDITVMNATARASLTPTATTGAIYCSIMNRGTADDRLLSISTPAAASAMIHETTVINDVMKMRMLETVLIPAGKTVELKTGGTHVMLMGLKAPLKRGETVEMEFVFEKAGVMRVEVPVGDVVAQ